MAIFTCTCGQGLGNYASERDGANAVRQHELSHRRGPAAARGAQEPGKK